MPAAKTIVPTEAQEQTALFRWAKIQSGKYPELNLLYHIPNEGKRSYIVGAQMKAEGLKKGVPDICLPVARSGYHGLYIEMKRIRNSRVSPEQTEWLEALREHGYRAEVCKGWQEAVMVIMKYLEAKE